MKKDKLVNNFVIGTFVVLYLIVSVISTIHVIDFFSLSNPFWLAVSLAIAFEVGAAASLASLIALDKMNKTLVWALFITITLMQMQGNMFYAFKNLNGYESWIQLFNLVDEDPLYQKRILAFVSGAILPLVALGFIKSLVDYIKPEKAQPQTLEENVESMRKVVDAHDSLVEEIEKKTNDDSVEVLEGPKGNNGPDDSTLRPIRSEESAESILGLTIDDEIEAEQEVEVSSNRNAKSLNDVKANAEGVVDDIIHNANDMNEYLVRRTAGHGLVNPRPQIRSVSDDRPTGFQHPNLKRDA